MFKKHGLGANALTAKAAYKKQFNFSMYANKVVTVNDKQIEVREVNENTESPTLLNSPSHLGNTNNEGNWTVKSYNAPTE